MASQVKIKAQLAAGANVNVKDKTQKVRSKANTDPVFIYIAESLDELQGSVIRIQESLRSPPEVGRISIAAADIADLIVGAEDGPGQLTIYSGPPSYTRIGWDGTDDSGLAVAISSVSGYSPAAFTEAASWRRTALGTTRFPLQYY